MVPAPNMPNNIAERDVMLLSTNANGMAVRTTERINPAMQDLKFPPLAPALSMFAALIYMTPIR